MNTKIDLPITSYIAIDPGEKTGLCHFDIVQKSWLKLAQTSPQKTMSYLTRVNATAEKTQTYIEVRIEDPNLNKPLYATRMEELHSMMDRIAYAIDLKMSQSQVGMCIETLQRLNKEFRILLRIAQNVGMNKQTAKFLILHAESLSNLHVIRIAPSVGGLTKAGVDEMYYLTGIRTKKSQQDLRDALGMMVGVLEKHAPHLIPEPPQIIPGMPSLAEMREKNPRADKILRAMTKGVIQQSIKQGRKKGYSRK